MVETGTEVAFAFALTFAAGLATCLGGIILFSKRLVSLTKPTRLGVFLAVAAGVMIFISFAEVFSHSVQYFQEGFKTTHLHDNHAHDHDHHDHDHHDHYHHDDHHHDHHHHDHHHHDHHDHEHLPYEEESSKGLANLFEPILMNHGSHGIKNTGNGECDSYCQGHSWASASASFLLGAMIIFLLDVIVHKLSPDTEEENGPSDFEMTHSKDIEAATAGTATWGGAVKDTSIADKQKDVSDKKEDNGIEQSQQLSNSSDAKMTKIQLTRMSIMTALAVGIHNLPEGIATYVAAKSGSRLGPVMAIGIALHNIPEGVAIAAPVYFASGSKLKALGWTLISGLAEPLGAFICWLLIGDGFDPVADGVIYGVVAGMMVTVSFKDLIPTSLKYNPNVYVFTSSMLSGIAIMIASSVFFAYAGL